MKIDIEETKRVAELYDIKIVPIKKDGKAIHFKNGSSITTVDGGNVVRSKEKNFDFDIRNIQKEQWNNSDNYLFLEEYFGIKFKWYQKLYFRIVGKLNKLGVIK